MKIVFDASVVLAFLGNEPGGDGATAHLPGAAISAVNLAEVASKLADRGMDSSIIAQVLENLGLHVVPFDTPAAHATAALRGPTRRAGLSLGDRACLALAQALGLPVMTADSSWAGLDLGVDVQLIR